MITVEQVNEACRKWLQANTVAAAMSNVGLSQDQVDALWKIEADMLNEYTVLYEAYQAQKEASNGSEV